MSKVNELRKKAIHAVRSQNWDEAVKLYERVCGLDNTNASYRNELGDVYLKKGEIPSAIQAFESAVELYMAVGLTNNAVAAHKKILRHNPGHLDSLWGLGEIRRRQNLETDASAHFLDFLRQANTVETAKREKFLDRCSLLMDNLPGDLQILSQLEGIFTNWKLTEEQARVLVLKAKLAKESGETDMVDKYVTRARGLMPLLDAMPDYRDLVGVASEEGSAPAGADDAIEMPRPEPTPESGEDLDFSLSIDDAAEETSADFLDLGLELEDEQEDGAAASSEPAPEPEAPTAAEPAGAASGPLDAEPDGRPENAQAPSSENADAPSSENVDLLDEILADGGLEEDPSDAEKRAVNGIVHGVQGQIAAHVSEGDHKGQYEVGIVYMDMGLFDQAVEAFSRAAEGEDHRLKALEMKGSCLTKLGRLEEALETFQQGLSIPGYPGRYYLGLLYEVGVCLEGLDRLTEARDYYQRVAAVDHGFLDVAVRLARLDEQQHSTA